MARSRMVLLLLLGATVLHAAPVGTLDVDPPARLIQGEPARVTVRYDGDEQLRRVEVAIIDPEGIRRGQSDAVYVAFTDGSAIWQALVAVPTLAEIGDWQIRVRAQDSRLGMESYHEVPVVEGEFAEMRVRLGRELTALMTEPDPRRARESRELRELLSESNPNAVFHLDRFELPLEPRRISAGFGDRRIYEYADGSERRSAHHGIDYAADTGTPVFAAGRGAVRLAAERVLSGNSVIIEHLPGIYSLYYHLDEVSVEKGQLIETGGKIGVVGMTGLATGPHLHWEVRVGGVAVDPDWFLENAPLAVEPRQ